MLAIALLLYEASNGVMAIVRAAIPAELFEREQYGAVNGALSAPVIMSRAAAPIAASWLWAMQQSYRPLLWTLVMTAALAVACFYCAVREKW